MEEEERALGLLASGGDVEVLILAAAGDLGSLEVGLERGERHVEAGEEMEGSSEMVSEGSRRHGAKAGLSGRVAIEPSG